MLRCRLRSSWSHYLAALSRKRKELKDYLVWYRKPYDTHDRVCATARNYELAENLAEAVFLDLRSRGKEVIEVGVKRSSPGILYQTEDFDLRWVVKKR